MTATLDCSKQDVLDRPQLHDLDTPLAWLESCARMLGLPPISGVVAKDLREVLPHPLDDARYRGNTLVPDSAPVEVSFAEGQAHALRLDLESFGFGISPANRRMHTIEMAAKWINSCFPSAIASELEQQLRSFCAKALARSATFGAFLGAVFDNSGLSEVKVYSECDDRFLADLPKGLAETAGEVLSTVAGLKPHFESISCGRSGCIPRIYFMCEEELPLLSLKKVLETAGLAHRLPELIALLLPWVGGSTILPAGAVVLSFRDKAGEIDCKLEILASGMPMPRALFANNIYRSMAERPQTLAAFLKWSLAVTGSARWPEEINAAGFRIAATAPAQFVAYLSPRKTLSTCPP